MSESPEEKIALAIRYWFSENASAYHFASNYEFQGELNDDEFKNLDLDKIWDLVAPDLKNYVKDYLEGYESNDGEQVWKAKDDKDDATLMIESLEAYQCLHFAKLDKIAALLKVDDDKEAQGE